MAGIPIVLRCGADYVFQAVATDSITGAPVVVTAPKMEIRADSNTGGTILYTSQGASPTITFTQPTSNTVAFAIAGSASKNGLVGVRGSYDCFATDPNGVVVQVAAGSFEAVPNVTAL